MRTLLAIAALMAASPALAQSNLPYPVAIPAECLDLARREGVPIILRNDSQTKKARATLARLDESNPAVRICRQAVGRVMARFGQ
jgi:hypothetical protein